MLFEKETLMERYKNDEEFRKLVNYLSKKMVTGKVNAFDLSQAKEAVILMHIDKINGDTYRDQNPRLLTE